MSIKTIWRVSANYQQIRYVLILRDYNRKTRLVTAIAESLVLLHAVSFSHNKQITISTNPKQII